MNRFSVRLLLFANFVAALFAAACIYSPATAQFLAILIPSLVFFGSIARQQHWLPGIVFGCLAASFLFLVWPPQPIVRDPGRFLSSMTSTSISLLVSIIAGRGPGYYR